MNDQEQIWLDQARAGDKTAFGYLVEAYLRPVYNLTYRMLGDPSEAEDAAQETFLRVVRNLHRWDPTRAFEPWLLTIAGNRCRTRLAKRMRRPGTLSLDYPVEDQSVELARAKLLNEEVDLALKHVREEYRQAFLLFHKREMCYAEIAETLDVPLGTVKTWVHRARRELIVRLRTRGVIGET